MTNRLEALMRAEERRAEKVQELNALLQDPDISDYVSKLFGEPLAVMPKPASHAANGNGNGSKLAHLTVTPAVRVIADLLPNRFLIQDAVKTMQDGGFDFGKRDPVPAVRDAVYLLCRGEKPIFRVAVKGEGGKPNQYERI